MNSVFANKTILVTGGTGSFGKAFIKKILSLNVKKVIVYSRDEFKQFTMASMPEFSPYKNVISYIIGDVRDKERLTQAMAGVDYVVHAAALKQVPSCEYNPFEAIKTNILGAENVIEAATENKVKKVIALSTDKACAPINLYGATKLCSDKLFIAANGNSNTKFSVVRYGNVLASRGSVIPFFQKLIQEGAQSLPITDVRMTRFWITLEQAIDMVVTAFSEMRGGELFVRKIPSSRMTDLAKAVAPDLGTHETGVRPGEKIHEMMIPTEDADRTLEFEQYYVIQPNAEWWKERAKNYGGKPVTGDFSYRSDNNSEWLTVEDIQQIITDLDNPEAKN